MEKDLQEALLLMARQDPAFRADVRFLFSRAPMEVAQSAPVVQALARAFEGSTGRRATFGGMSAWMDSSLLSAAGIPSVVLGPTGEGLHGESEWVDLPSVFAASEVALRLISDFCS